jgi:hypothetical protein
MAISGCLAGLTEGEAEKEGLEVGEEIVLDILDER